MLSGLPGVGESPLARAFCAGARAVHLRADTIDAAVMRSSLAPSSAEEVGTVVAAAQAEEMLVPGHVVLADAVTGEPEAHAIWDAVPGQAATVEVVCSDVDVHRARVERRRAETPPDACSVPDWPAVASRRWVAWDRPTLRLDSAREAPEVLAHRLRAAPACAHPSS